MSARQKGVVLRDVLEVKYGARLVPVDASGADGKYEALLHTQPAQLEALLQNA